MKEESHEKGIPSSPPSLMSQTQWVLLLLLGATIVAVLAGWLDVISQAIMQYLEPLMLLNTLFLSGMLLFVGFSFYYSLSVRANWFERRWKNCPLIHFAKYGYADDWIDVTEEVRDRIGNDGILRVTAGNHLAGDPHHGHGKDLIIKYTLNGNQGNKSVKEGVTIEIPKNKS